MPSEYNPYVLDKDYQKDQEDQFRAHIGDLNKTAVKPLPSPPPVPPPPAAPPAAPPPAVPPPMGGPPEGDRPPSEFEPPSATDPIDAFRAHVASLDAAAEPMPTAPKDTTPPEQPNAPGWGTSLMHGVGDTASQFGGALKFAGSRVNDMAAKNPIAKGMLAGNPVATALGETERLGVPEAAQAAGKAITDKNPVETPKDVNPLDPTWWRDAVAPQIPNTVAFVALAASTAGAGVLGTAALSRTVEASMEAAGAEEEARSRGMDDAKAKAAANQVFMENLALGGADALQVALTFAKAPAPLKKAITGVMGKTWGKVGLAAASFLGTAASEGGEEVVQDFIKQNALGDPLSVDPQTFAVGAATGGAFHVIPHLAESAMEAHQHQVENAAGRHLGVVSPWMRAGSGDDQSFETLQSALDARDGAEMGRPRQTAANDVHDAALDAMAEAQQRVKRSGEDVAAQPALLPDVTDAERHQANQAGALELMKPYFDRMGDDEIEALLTSENAERHQDGDALLAVDSAGLPDLAAQELAARNPKTRLAPTHDHPDAEKQVDVRAADFRQKIERATTPEQLDDLKAQVDDAWNADTIRSHHANDLLPLIDQRLHDIHEPPDEETAPGTTTQEAHPAQTAAPAQPSTERRVFYRGTNPSDARRISTGAGDWDGHLFVTSTPENAKLYGDTVEAVEAKPDAKILVEGTTDFRKVVGAPWEGQKISMLDWARQSVGKATAAGYDAVQFARQTDLGTVVVNQDKFVRNAGTSQDAPPAQTAAPAWLDTLDVNAHERVLDAMRQVHDQADAAAKREIALKPRGGEIPVGAAGFDEFLSSEARNQFLMGVNKGQDPAAAADAARAWARGAVSRHNAQRAKDVNWQRASTHADTTIANAQRVVEYATTNKAPAPAAPAPTVATSAQSYDDLIDPSKAKMSLRDVRMRMQNADHAAFRVERSQAPWTSAGEDDLGGMKKASSDIERYLAPTEAGRSNRYDTHADMEQQARSAAQQLRSYADAAERSGETDAGGSGADLAKQLRGRADRLEAKIAERKAYAETSLASYKEGVASYATRRAATAQPVETLKVSQKGWSGNIFEDGSTYAADGYVLIDKSVAGGSTKLLNKKDVSRNMAATDADKLGAKMIAENAAKTTMPAKIVGFVDGITNGGAKTSEVQPALVEAADGTPRWVDAKKVRLLQHTTKYDEVRVAPEGVQFTNGGPMPVTFYRKGQPVAILMPVGDASQQVDVDEMRRTLGVEPAAPKETTDGHQEQASPAQGPEVRPEDGSQGTESVPDHVQQGPDGAQQGPDAAGQGQAPDAVGHPAAHQDAVLDDAKSLRAAIRDLVAGEATHAPDGGVPQIAAIEKRIEDALDGGKITDAQQASLTKSLALGADKMSKAREKRDMERRDAELNAHFTSTKGPGAEQTTQEAPPAETPSADATPVEPSAPMPAVEPSASTDTGAPVDNAPDAPPTEATPAAPDTRTPEEVATDALPVDAPNPTKFSRRIKQVTTHGGLYRVLEDLNKTDFPPEMKTALKAEMAAKQARLDEAKGIDRTTGTTDEEKPPLERTRPAVWDDPLDPGPDERPPVEGTSARQLGAQTEARAPSARQQKAAQQSAARNGGPPPPPTETGDGAPDENSRERGADVLAGARQGRNPPEKTALEKIKAYSGYLVRQLYDRYFDLRYLDRMAGLDENSGTHAAAQVMSGAVAHGQNLLRRHVMPVLDAMDNAQVGWLHDMWMLYDFKDRLAQDPGAELPGGRRVGTPDEGLTELRRRIGEENWNVVHSALFDTEKGQGRMGLLEFNQTHVLRPLLSKGIIDKSTYAKLIKDHQHYLPGQRALYQADMPEHMLPATERADIPGTLLKAREAGGSDLALDEPVARWMAGVIATQVHISRNRAARMVVQALQGQDELEAKAADPSYVQRSPQEMQRRLAAGEIPSGTISSRQVNVYTETKDQRSDRLTGGGLPGKTIGFYVDGVRFNATVPEVYADMAKGLEAEPASVYVKVLSKLSAPLRAGATALSVGFTLRNAMRDAQSMAVREGFSINSPYYWRGLAAALSESDTLRPVAEKIGIKQTAGTMADFDAAAEAGVFMSGLVEYGTGANERDYIKAARDVSDPARAIRKEIQDAPLKGVTVSSGEAAILQMAALLAAAKGGAASVLHAGAKATTPILEFNTALERAPRIATFLKVRDEVTAKRNARVQELMAPGQDGAVLSREGAEAQAAQEMPDEALDLESGVRGRDVNVDFAKSGNLIRTLNMITPFLNARIQGTANTIRSAQSNPRRFMAKVVGIAAMPALAAFAWNITQHPETWQLVPDYEWDKNYVFIIGEEQQNVDPSRPGAQERRAPILLRIPKGEAAAIVTAPLEAALRGFAAKNNRSFADHFFSAAQTLVDAASPIPTPRESLLSARGAGFALGSTLAPPIAQTTFGALSGKDMYLGQDIVPRGEAQRPAREQFGAETRKSAVLAGQAFGVSPRLVEWGAKAYGAGAADQAMWLLDLGLGAIGYDPTPIGQNLRRQPTTEERVARVPGVSSVLGIASGQEDRLGYDRLQKEHERVQTEMYAIPHMRDLGVGLGEAAAQITLGGKTKVAVDLKPAERAEYQRMAWEKTKPILDSIARDPQFASETTQVQRRIVDKVMAKGRDMVRGDVLDMIGHDELARRVDAALEAAQQ